MSVSIFGLLLECYQVTNNQYYLIPTIILATLCMMWQIYFCFWYDWDGPALNYAHIHSATITQQPIAIQTPLLHQHLTTKKVKTF